MQEDKHKFKTISKILEHKNIEEHMREEQSKTLTVITNENHTDFSENKKTATNPHSEYHTNPMYEKLLQFKANQTKQRFTVEDLLRW